MQPIDRKTPNTLEWKQESAFGRYFELKGGESLYGTIEFVKKFGSLAEARTATGSWSFKRRGMLTPTVAVRESGKEEDIAIYKPKWSSWKGELTLNGGENLKFESASMWGKDWVLSASGETPLLRFTTRGLLKSAAEVQVEPAGHSRADLPLLLCLCWYLIELYRLDADAGGAAAAGVV